MEFSLEIKRPTVAQNFAAREDHQRSKLITFQAIFTKNDKEKMNMTQASEAIIFEKLPLIQALFNSKLNGILKDDEDQICYDPEHARTQRPAFPKIPGKTVYMYNLIQSSFKNQGREYEQIVKLNIGTLWTMIECLVRFLDGKPLPPNSKMGLMEKHWDLELIGIEILAIYLGCTEINDRSVRNALVSYMRRLPTSRLTNSSSTSEKASETTNHAKMFNGNNSRQAEVIDLTEDDHIGQLASIPKSSELEPAPASTFKKSRQTAQPKLNLQKPKIRNQPAATLQKSKNSTQSKSTLQRQKKATRPSSTQQKIDQEPNWIATSQTSIEVTRSNFTRQGPRSIPIDAYISLNETYGCFLHVHIGSAMKGSGLIGRLLQDLHMGLFNTGDMSKVVGKGRNGKPMLIWDEVLEYFSVPGNVVENMLSWCEDDRWTPMVMFIERCQLDRALWQDWDERDLALAKYFDMFVKATPVVKDI
ncbi:uncharacterized protein Bfra_004703 [Botrytis fragariae]|uniref:Uncharacterized protein n=1 Tax=Botrytis fragariae TaxID=1964551 RepID=A0A8H6AVT0_9HELO|nr:uncharacterized protein Bfra_004703 [Botrytis fragariae]KAF5874688.1 hypothetical protein Bfra_004703 [Botrytis fragariae]